MKSKAIIFLGLLFLTTYTVLAQPPRENKLKTLKIGYITETLELTPSEAEKFWPIYNLHQDKIHKIRKNNMQKVLHEMQNKDYIENLSEDEAKQLLEQVLKKDEIIQKERSLMFKKLKTVLSTKKLLKLHKVEHDFNRKILEQYKRRRINN